MSSPQLLVVDDDPITGNITRELLSEAGFDAELLSFSLDTISTLKRKAYDAVLLDILMPGIDGLTLLHKIKNDPVLESLKVIIVSGKSFAADKERAKQYGAALFIDKPYNVEKFPAQIWELFKDSAPESSDAFPAPTRAAPAESAPAGALAAAPAHSLEVTIWGSRGPSAAVQKTPSRYGRRTACVSLSLGENLIVFDAGSGLLPLSERVLAAGRPKEIWIFITHFHRDHVEGFADFSLARTKGYTLRIGGANEPGKNLQQLLGEALQSASSRAPLAAKIELYEMLEESYEIIPKTILTAFYANHPGTCLGFMVKAKGLKVAYCPDSELYGEAATAMQDYDERLGKICAGADLLILDGRYTEEDYQAHRDSGHSSFLNALHFAGQHGVKRLILFHQDAGYGDAELDLMEKTAAKTISERNYALQSWVAREGLKINI